jgi:hypothetical protein
MMDKTKIENLSEEDETSSGWHELWHRIEDSPTNVAEYELVMDNAKSHQAKLNIVPLSLQSSSHHQRTRSSRRGGTRQRARSNSTSTSRNSTYKVQQYSTTNTTPSSVKTMSGATTDDMALTKTLLWKPGPVRRIVSSDGIFDDDKVFDRWMASQQPKKADTCGGSATQSNPVVVVDKTTQDTVQDYDDDESSESEGDDVPSHAYLNANRPMRQPSEDPEEILKLVQNMRAKGLIQ